MATITTLFLDIGGVLLTNGWDTHSREAAAKKFDIDFEEFNKRHQLTFDIYELGKISLDEYLNRAVFYERRSFSIDDFKNFMYSQSKPFPEMLELMNALKKQFNLKMVAVSNEGRDLTLHRIQKFHLNQFIDFFVSSCFVHLKKPDNEIYQVAIDCAQVPLKEILYIDDRDLFVQVAQGLGIQGICHRDYNETLEKLAGYGLRLK